MNYILILTQLFMIASCSQIRPIEGNKEVHSMSKPERPIVSEPKEVTVRPGKITFVEFEVNLPDGKWELDCKGKKISFIVSNNQAQGFLAESYFSDMKPFECEYIEDDDLNSSESTVVLNVSVKPFKYKSERLYVDKRRVEIKGKDLERVLKEKEIKKQIYENSASYYLFDRPFKRPLNSYITSYYGNRRVFNNKKKSQHLGNDFRARVGVSIPAANKGKVIFTGHLFFIGKVVVIDHGLDIFSVYGHLSKIKARKGDLVEQGDIIGLAGRTGRVSGPHLHWGVKIQGQWVDGFSLVKASEKKFNTLKSN